MKREFGILLIGLSLLMLTVTGCANSNVKVVYGSESDEVALVEQFEAVRHTMDNFFSCGRIISMSAEELDEIIAEQNEDYYLVDIRANQDFTKKNIPGSVSIPYNQTADAQKLETLPTDKTIVIIDYNGHLAAQTAATWKQLGYKTMPLAYGIQSWTKELAAINYEIFPNNPLGYPVTTENEEIADVEYELPVIEYPEGETKAYIAATVNTYLNRNYKGIITAEELYKNLQGDANPYMLIDIREAKHYKMGHISGAVNIPLHKLAEVKNIKSYNPDQRIVLIGYDGMDASQSARVLVTLGYDAVALKYGMSYWTADEDVIGVAPIHSLVKEHYSMLPLNYLAPSTGVAGCA